MRFVIFTHSLVSDWNHGNAHFIRGIVSELLSRDHEVSILEPENGWSLRNLMRDHGLQAVEDFNAAFPHLRSQFYAEETLDVSNTLRGADVVIVHEWNSQSLIARIGEHRASHDYFLLFHDTHHRAFSDPDAMGRYDLRGYDGVLAYGSVIRSLYLERGWAKDAFTWHEAADTRVFKPIADQPKQGDLVWIGNWGDGERVESLREFLIEPVKKLRLNARVYGVRYPEKALRELHDAGIEYGGWLPNYKVPEVFAGYRVTVHVPRGPYVRDLPGIPTIRPFEALACGIPMISAPWIDSEHLFFPGKDFLFAKDGLDMVSKLERVLSDRKRSRELAESGLRTIHARHTCRHRVDELFECVLERNQACV